MPFSNKPYKIIDKKGKPPIKRGISQPKPISSSRSDPSLTVSKRNVNATIKSKDYQAIKEVVQALTAFTVPSSAATSWTGTNSSGSNRSTVSSSNHITGLVDSDNIANMGKNKTDTRQFIQERGVNNISRYQGLLVNEQIGMIMVNCCHPLCQSTMPLVEARKVYKSCHHCYSYYCCVQCRQEDWNNHKMTICPIGRTVSAVKSVIRKILSDETIHNTFSNLARGGYLRMGRGCVVLWFSSCSDAESFVKYGSSQFNNYPVFVCIKNIHILISQFVPSSLSAIYEACNNYDPQRNIVINISVAVDEHLLKMCPVKIRHNTIHAVKKFVTVSLSKIFLDSLAAKEMYDDLRPTSLLLTMLPNQHIEDHLNYKDRQIVFVNILRQLENRGVNLEHQYPSLYRGLMNFVEENEDFSPTTIYPIDKLTGRVFVCMIAPHSDPIISADKFTNIQSDRSSCGSFMAELETLSTDWKQNDVTDL